MSDGEGVNWHDPGCSPEICVQRVRVVGVTMEEGAEGHDPFFRDRHTESNDGLG